MKKMKTKKSLEKRVKITSSGKILRKHQLEKAKKPMTFAKGDLKNVKKMLGV